MDVGGNPAEGTTNHERRRCCRAQAYRHRTPSRPCASADPHAPSRSRARPATLGAGVRTHRTAANRPLMGWTGTDDTLAQARLEFRNLQGAIDFAEKQGWRYEVAEPPARAATGPRTTRNNWSAISSGRPSGSVPARGSSQSPTAGRVGGPKARSADRGPALRLLRRIRSKRPGRNWPLSRCDRRPGSERPRIRRRGSGASQSCPDHSRDGLPRLADRAPREEG